MKPAKQLQLPSYRRILRRRRECPKYICAYFVHIMSAIKTAAFFQVCIIVIIIIVSTFVGGNENATNDADTESS